MKTRSTPSTPPPHVASRGGIDATQMAPEGEIPGHESGKGQAQKGEASHPVGRLHLTRAIGRLEARLARGGKVKIDGLLAEHLQGHGMGADVAAVHGQRHAPEQAQRQNEVCKHAPQLAPAVTISGCSALEHICIPPVAVTSAAPHRPLFTSITEPSD